MSKKYRCPHCGRIEATDTCAVTKCENCFRLYSIKEIKIAEPVPDFELPAGPWALIKREERTVVGDSEGRGIIYCYNDYENRLAECLTTFPELVKEVERYLHHLEIEAGTPFSRINKLKALLKRAKGES